MFLEFFDNFGKILVLVKKCGLGSKIMSNYTENDQISTQNPSPGGKVAEQSEVGRGTARSDSRENA